MSSNKSKQNKRHAQHDEPANNGEPALDDALPKKIVALARTFRQTLKQLSSFENELRDEVTFNLKPKKGDQQTHVASKLQEHAQDFVKVLDLLHQAVPDIELLHNEVSKFSARALSTSLKLQAQIEKMKEEEEAKRQKVAQSEPKLSELKNELRILEAVNKEAHGKLAAKEQEAKKYTLQILQQQKQIEEMKTKLGALQQMDSLRAQLTEAQQKCQKADLALAQETTSRIQAQKELQAKQQQIDQQTLLYNQTSIQLNAQKRERERMTLSLNEHIGTIQKQTALLKEEKDAHAKSRQDLFSAQQEMEKIKLSAEQETKKEIEKKEKMEKSYSQQLQQLQQQFQQQLMYENGQLQQSYNENSRLNDLCQQAQLRIQQLEQEIQTKEKEQQEKLAKQAQSVGDILFEEDLLSALDLDNKQQVSPRDITKLFQVIDFFDKSKPDGFEIRNIFFSDQTAAKESGQHVILLSHQDLETFDYFSQVIRGTSKEHARTREDAIDNAVSFIHNFLLRSQEVCNYNVTFKQICDQISELAASNIFLNGSAEFPYTENDSTSRATPSAEDIVGEELQQATSDAKLINNSSSSNWDAHKNDQIRLTIVKDDVPVPSSLPMANKEQQQQKHTSPVKSSQQQAPFKEKKGNSKQWGDIVEEGEVPKDRPQAKQQQQHQGNNVSAPSSRLTNWTSGGQDEQQQQQQQQHSSKAQPNRGNKPNQQQQQQQKPMGARGGRGGNRRGGYPRSVRRISYQEAEN